MKFVKCLFLVILSLCSHDFLSMSFDSKKLPELMALSKSASINLKETSEIIDYLSERKGLKNDYLIILKAKLRGIVTQLIRFKRTRHNPYDYGDVVKNAVYCPDIVQKILLKLMSTNTTDFVMKIFYLRAEVAQAFKIVCSCDKFIGIPFITPSVGAII